MFFGQPKDVAIDFHDADREDRPKPSGRKPTPLRSELDNARRNGSGETQREIARNEGILIALEKVSESAATRKCGDYGVQQ